MMNQSMLSKGLFAALGLVLVFAYLPGQAQAQAQEPVQDQEQADEVVIGEAGALGVGLGFGTFTSGVSAKYYLLDQQAVQALGGFWGNRGFSLGVDYIVEFEPLVEAEAGNLVAGIGGGGTVVYYSVSFGFLNQSSQSAFLFGANGLGALSFQFADIPLEIAVELRPTMLFGDFVSGFYLGTGGAVRYYF